MKKSYCALFSFLLIGTFAFSQNTKEFDFKDFFILDISNAFVVEIVQSENYKIVVEYPDRMESHLKIEQHEDEVEIGLKSGKSGGSQAPKATIHMPILSEIEISGACKVQLVKFELNKLEVELSGASTLEGDLSVKDIEITVSGASNIGFSGLANKMSLFISGASAFRGKGFLISDELLLDCSGASSANCQVDGDMFVKLSGASRFTYHGEGDILKQELSGASEIIKQ